MGRSYWFECSKCSYRAKVAGKADRGLHVFVETVTCQDCKELYDAVTRVRIPDEAHPQGRLTSFGLRRAISLAQLRNSKGPPAFQSVLALLPYTGVKRFKWLHFKAQCPVSPTHEVQAWNAPGKCPRCGLLLEKNTLPYRIWE